MSNSVVVASAGQGLMVTNDQTGRTNLVPGVVLIDPATGLPYAAGGGGGSVTVDTSTLTKEATQLQVRDELVSIDGKTVNSCLMYAVDCDGREVVTIEGLRTPKGMHPVQQAFVDHGAVQCGFCMPGMIMQAHHLIENNPKLTREEAQRPTRLLTGDKISITVTRALVTLSWISMLCWRNGIS